MKKIPVELNKEYTVDIVDLTNEGAGVARIEGFTVFVEEALPGEKVDCIIYSISKNCAKARTTKIIGKSKYRIDTYCTKEQCGGCKLKNMSYEGQLAYKYNKVKNAMQRIGKIDTFIQDIIPSEKIFNYRNKMEYTVGYDKGYGKLGFLKEKSHDVVYTDDCSLGAVENKIVVNSINIFLRKYRTNDIKRVILKTTTQHDIMVIFESEGDTLAKEGKIIYQLKGLSNVKSIVHIKENKVRVIYGSDKLIETIGNFKFYITPLSFFQVNSEQTLKLYQKAYEYAELSGQETLIDVYCGVGTIGLFMAKKAKKIYGIEIVREAILSANENAKLNGINNAQFITGDAGEKIKNLYKSGVKADVVVIDPPRKGCDKELINTLIEMRPKRIVYVSCDPATLARDLNILSNGGFSVIEVQPIDMFPQTVHVECIVLIKRAESRMK